MVFVPDRGRSTGEPQLLLVWRAAHVATTVVVPWVLALRFSSGEPHTIADEARLAFEYFSGLAITSGVLLANAAFLRLLGRSAAATIPFVVFWAVLGAGAMSEAYGLREPYACGGGLCMPGFGAFIVAIPLAVVLSAAVLGSAAINHASRNGGAVLSGEAG